MCNILPQGVEQEGAEASYLDISCGIRYNTKIAKYYIWEGNEAGIPGFHLKGSGDNMEEKKNLLTYAGLTQLEDELQNLKVVQRKEVAQKIKEAREQGDLSENAEYDAAKDEQRDIEARIEQIEKILKNAEVVVEDEVDLNSISVGCKVKVHDMEFDEDIEFKIVGSTEANSLQGKISNESPVGRALIGAKMGDTVSVEMPAGVMEYKILDIQRNI